MPQNSLGSHRGAGHTPQHSGSVGPMGQLTPQTSTGDGQSQAASKKVKTGGAFDKARKLLRRKPKEEDKQQPLMPQQAPQQTPSRQTTPQPQYPQQGQYAQYGQQSQGHGQQFGPHQYAQMNGSMGMGMNGGMYSSQHAQAH